MKTGLIALILSCSLSISFTQGGQIAVIKNGKIIKIVQQEEPYSIFSRKGFTYTSNEELEKQGYIKIRHRGPFQKPHIVTFDYSDE